MSNCKVKGLKQYRMYTNDAAEKLYGKIIICDEESCDGEPCKGKHNVPHKYDDLECFCSCNWPGHSGLCVEIDKIK